MGINRQLFQKHFKIQRPCSMLRDLHNTNNKKNNSALVNVR